MAIQYMRPLPGRKANFGLITEWSAERRWLAHSDTRFEEEWTVLEYGWNNDILPIPYVNVLGTQPLLLCRAVIPEQVKESPQHWIITANYNSHPLSQAEKDAQQYENPLDRPPRVKWSSTKYNKTIVTDIDDKPILNSAGDPFDPPPEVDRSRFVATVTANVEAVPIAMISYTDAVNLDAFTIQGVTVGSGLAKIMSMEVSDEQIAQIAEDEFVTYYIFTYSLEFRSETWALFLLDQGYRAIDPNDSSKRIEILDDGAKPRPVKKPWPLDGAGNKLSNPSTSNAVPLRFQVYNEFEFGGVLPGLDQLE